MVIKRRGIYKGIYKVLESTVGSDYVLCPSR